VASSCRPVQAKCLHTSQSSYRPLKSDRVFKAQLTPLCSESCLITQILKIRISADICRYVLSVRSCDFRCHDRTFVCSCEASPVCSSSGTWRARAHGGQGKGQRHVEPGRPEGDTCARGGLAARPRARLERLQERHVAQACAGAGEVHPCRQDGEGPSAEAGKSQQQASTLV
jgi:hypothetical protein